MIPKKIYTIWHTNKLCPNMIQNLNLLKLDNPEFEVIFFDSDQCQSFLQMNFSSDVLYSYNNLIPEAYKSDLCRYCLLYINGGIYIDIKLMCVKGFSFKNLDLEKEYYVLGEEGNVMNGLMICNKYNEILLKCINRIVSNVKDKYLGTNSLEPTGPFLLGSYFSKEQKDFMKMKFLNTTKNTGITLNNKFILVYYKEYRQDQMKYYSDKEYYLILWNRKEIYDR